MHLTDTHLFASPDGELRGATTYRSLQAVLSHYLQHAWRADTVLVTGDLIQDDSPAAYERFCELLAPLQLPVYCLPGNHDVRPLMRSAIIGAGFHYCDSTERNDWQLICLDSCVDGQAGGRMADTELRRLESELTERTAARTLVSLHHPPVPMGSAWLDTVGLYNADRFLGIIGQVPDVSVVLFGHVHQPYDALHNGVRIIATPSTCRQFAQGSEEFAVDESPPAYRRLSLHRDGRFEQQLQWVG